MNVNRTKTLLISIEKCSHDEFSAAATEKLPGWRNVTHERLRGPATWKDMLRSALRDCELAKTQIN